MSEEKPSEFFGLLGLGGLCDFISPAAIERTKAEYRRGLEQELQARVDLARALTQERQAPEGARRDLETIERDERENSEAQRLAFLNLRELDAADDIDIQIRFVKPDDPISDADREAYAKWCEGDRKRQELIRKNAEAQRLAYLKRCEAVISFDRLEEQQGNEPGEIN